MHVYSCRVSASRSNYHIVVPDKYFDIVTAYHGLIFIGDGTHFVHRFAFHAYGIPQDFPTQHLSLVLDYDYRRIGDSDYLLPREFEIRSLQGWSLLKTSALWPGNRSSLRSASPRFHSQAVSNTGPSENALA